MPKLISGNTMAASVMVGEKGAHHILHGLTPPDLADGPV
jgi:choline dehydrogenase-like flavoprotein